MKVQLPGFVLAELYGDTLVQLPETKTDKKIPEPRKITQTIDKLPAEPPEIFYTGGNKKHLLLLVNQPDAVFLTDEAHATLSRLLEALHFSFEDIAVVNFSRNPLPYERIKAMLHPQYCLLFEVDLQKFGLPFEIPEYQVQRYDGCIFLTASALTLSGVTEEPVKKEKRKLWQSLKKIFPA